jgi:transcriptional regulator with XRE-family HTH domain
MISIDRFKLHRCMANVGVTQKELAAKVGVSQQYISNMLGGHRAAKRNPALRLRIAEALGVELGAIERDLTK